MWFMQTTGSDRCTLPKRNGEKSHPRRACGVGLGAGSWDSATQTRDSVARRDRLAKSGSLYTQTHGTLLRLRFDSEMRVTAPARDAGGKEGRRQAHKNIMPHQPIYLWEITVNKSFIAVTSSWDSSPWPANGRRAHRPAGTVGRGTRGRGIK